jgi:uncharacterized membrane protein YadS
VLACAAIGIKSQLKELATAGLKPVLLMLGESALLVALILVLQRALHGWQVCDSTRTAPAGCSR